MKRKSGFTLIELLIVIAIIAVLVTILVPALTNAREQARRARCMVQLKTWGEAVNMYVSVNKMRVMRTTRRWWDAVDGEWVPYYISAQENYPDPDRPRSIHAWNSQGEWNVPGMNPYIQSFSPDFGNDGIATEMITCPSADAGYLEKWNAWLWASEWYDNDPDPLLAFAEIGYAYFGRADQVTPSRCSLNAPRYLTNRELEEGRILMTDTIYFNPDTGYRYNHGRGGWSWNAPLGQPGYEWVRNVDPRVEYPDATGLSRMYGDTSVKWINIPAVPNLPIHEDPYLDAINGEWNGYESGYVGIGDIAYF